MRPILLSSCAALVLAGCTTSMSAPDERMPARVPEGQCDASGVQDHIGHRATAEAGATLLRLTGATILRWAPPRSAMTMDYRPERLTVSYDDAMMVDRIMCG